MIDVSYTDAPPKSQVPEYPYLAKKHSLIIYVTGDGYADSEFSGFVIASNGSYELGQFSERWVKTEFQRFEGSITLYNKKEF